MSASPGRLASRQLLASRILATRAAETLSAAQCAALLRMAPEQAVDAIERRTSTSLSLQHHVTHPLVDAYCTLGRHDDAVRVLRSHRPTDATPFNPLLVACVRLGDDSALREATGLMRELGAPPTVDTYGELILARVERGEALRALRVCESALYAGIVPPRRACTALIVALSEAGLTGSALDLAFELRVRHNRRLDSTDRATQALIDGAAEAEMPLEVLAVHSELRQHHGFALADEMVLRCVRAGNVPAARALLRQLEAEGVPVGKEPLDELLLAMLDREDVSEAFDLWDRQRAVVASPMPGFEQHAGRRWVHGGDSGAQDATAAAAATTVEVLGLGDSEAKSSPVELPPLTLELDLRGLPEGAARLSCMRYFQRLANAAPTEALLAGRPGWSGWSDAADGDALRVLLTDMAHADGLREQAASLQPPIELRVEEARTRGEADAGATGDGAVVLMADRESRALGASLRRAAARQTAQKRPCARRRIAQRLVDHGAARMDRTGVEEVRSIILPSKLAACSHVFSQSDNTACYSLQLYV